MEGSLLYIIIVGGVAGFLAGLLMKKGFGIIVNIILGIVGAFVGNWLFGILNISIGTGVINDIVTAVAGSVVILFVAGLLKK